MTATAGLARRLFKVANDSLTADLELRRAVFVKTMLELPHWTTGSGPRQQTREMCAAELHHRAGMFTTAITTAHRALHATQRREDVSRDPRPAASGAQTSVTARRRKLN